MGSHAYRKSARCPADGSPVGVVDEQRGPGAQVAARLCLGKVWINDYHPYVPQAEWGGVKHSGFGRELGPAVLAEYRETKHIWRNTAPSP
ncbi:aldehyde dehydrogenase family protein, partial [Streptomyces sp. PSKA30]|nr:aldehyde dehydrogenase family protein [Streptomyces sp. PSKA30]